MQSGGVHHGARGDRLVLERQIESVAAGGSTERVRPPQHDGAVRFGEAQQRAHERLRLHPSSGGRPERRCREDVGLALSQELEADHLQPAHAVRRAAAFQRFERADLLLGRRDDELAATIVRNVIGRAERVQPFGPLDAQLRLEAPAGVVDPGVDDAAVVRAGFHPGAGMAFGDRNRKAGGSQFGRRREACNASAYDEGIDDLDATV